MVALQDRIAISVHGIDSSFANRGPWSQQSTSIGNLATCFRAWCHDVTSELHGLRQSVRRGRPFGDEGWVEVTAGRLQLEQPLRAQGRPPKREEQPTTAAVQPMLFP